MSRNHNVYNEDNVYDKLEDPNVDVGDTISYIPDNQMGYKKYKVVNNLGKKKLKFIGDLEGSYGPTYNVESKYNMGGKRRTRKRKHKSHQNKSRKHKRRSHKNKRRSSKRR